MRVSEVVVVGAVALGAACKQPAPHAPAVTSAPQPRASNREPGPAIATPQAPDAAEDAGSVLDRLREFRHKVELDRGSYEALSQNKGSHLSSLRRYKNISDWEGVVVRVPDTPWIDQLTKDLREALTRVGLSNIDVRATDRPIHRRKLPETAPEGPGFAFEEDDIRGVIDIHVVADGADAERSKKALETLNGFIRVLTVSAYSDKGGRLDAALTAYYFVPLTPPKLIPRKRDLDADLRAAGFDPVALTTNVDTRAVVAAMRADYAAMHAREKEFAEALALHGEISHWDAKLRFFRKLTGGGPETRATQKQGRR